MRTPSLPVSEPLARLLEGASDAFMLEWLNGARRQPGNPCGLRLERIGAAVAPASPGAPEVDFLNRVIGLWPEDADRVPELVAFYRGLGIRPWFELAPATDLERLAAALARAGAVEVGVQAVLYGRCEASSDLAAGCVEVSEVGPGGAREVADLLLAGNEVHNADRRLHDAWSENERWRFYVARVDGAPAGGAVLRVEGGMALLATAATTPALRRRGVQRGLIARRLADAAAAGCELVSALAQFASQSQRNLEAAGLRVAYTKAVWRLVG